VKTIALLFASNVFMTAAWYGHFSLQGSADVEGDPGSRGRSAFSSTAWQVPATAWATVATPRPAGRWRRSHHRSSSSPASPRSGLGERCAGTKRRPSRSCSQRRRRQPALIAATAAATRLIPAPDGPRRARSCSRWTTSLSISSSASASAMPRWAVSVSVRAVGRAQDPGDLASIAWAVARVLPRGDHSSPGMSGEAPRRKARPSFRSQRRCLHRRKREGGQLHARRGELFREPVLAKSRERA